MNNNYRFQLDSSVGKGTCPICGAKKRFTLYVDRQEGNQILDYSVGMCDRKDGGCQDPQQPYWKWEGFHEYLKEFPNLYNDSDYEYSDKDNHKEEKIIHYIDKSELDKLDYYSEENTFVQFLKGLGMADIDIMRLFKKMNVRVLNNNNVIFFYEDLEDRITRGKIIEYGRDGHKKSITGLHYELRKIGEIGEDEKEGDIHLFGLHLLKDLPENIRIGVVESEKTAILCNHFFKDKGVVFMASGSLVNINTETLKPLKDRKIVIYPDKGTAFDLYLKLNVDRIQQCIFKNEIVVKNDFENKYKQNGYDLGDFICWNYPKTNDKVDFDRIFDYSGAYCTARSGVNCTTHSGL